MTLTLLTPPTRRMSRLALAFGRFVEEAAGAERERRLAPIENETAREVGRWFVAQGRAMVAALAPVAGPYLDAGARRESAGQWDYLIAQVMRRPYGGASQLGDIIAGSHRRGYLAGSNVTRASLGGNNPAFWLGNDDAVAYARQHAAARVTQIDETTRRELNGLLSDAIEKRLTWRETADLIEERYADMAGPPLFPSRTHRRRAQMIAAFETRDAYEAGGMAQAERLAGGGQEVEKRWAYLRDGKARDAHRANGDAGWVALDHQYADGTTRPPTDGGCRCALVFRTRPGASGPAGATAVPGEADEVRRALGWLLGDTSSVARVRPAGLDVADALLAARREQVARQLAEATGLPPFSVARVLYQWADTSNGDANSLLIQRAAADVFGVRLSGWQERLEVEMQIGALLNPRWRAPSLFADPDNPAASVAGFMSDRAAVGSLLRGMYADTRRTLREAGVERLTVWRGLTLPVTNLPALTPGGTVLMEQTALGSWSLSVEVARKFARRPSPPGYVGLVVRSDIEARHILSTSRTGFGSLREMEVVALQNPADMALEWIGEPARESAARDGRLTEATARDDEVARRAADWLHSVGAVAYAQERRVLAALVARLTAEWRQEAGRG